MVVVKSREDERAERNLRRLFTYFSVKMPLRNRELFMFLLFIIILIIKP